jgi:hypothetical protein
MTEICRTELEGQGYAAEVSRDLVVAGGTHRLFENPDPSF